MTLMTCVVSNLNCSQIYDHDCLMSYQFKCKVKIVDIYSYFLFNVYEVGQCCYLRTGFSGSFGYVYERS